MTEIKLRELSIDDEIPFLDMANISRSYHRPWIMAPLTADEFADYLTRFKKPNQMCLLAYRDHEIVGVFNLSEIVHGCFQNAYLGFFGNKTYAGKGYMSQALKLVLDKVFNEMGLHRLEANIQPDNLKSIRLVQKNHFRKEGYSPRYLKINDEWCDHERWAITSEDWLR